MLVTEEFEGTGDTCSVVVGGKVSALMVVRELLNKGIPFAITTLPLENYRIIAGEQPFTTALFSMVRFLQEGTKSA